MLKKPLAGGEGGVNTPSPSVTTDERRIHKKEQPPPLTHSHILCFSARETEHRERDTQRQQKALLLLRLLLSSPRHEIW